MAKGNEQTESLERDRVEVYIDKADEYRWRKRAANGEIVGDSGEGYKNRGDCIAQAMENRGNLAVVLFRKDGSMHGEIQHDDSNPSEDPIVITPTPAGEVNQ